MKLDSFKQILLKKASGNKELEKLIKNTNDNFFSERILEILEKMAEDKKRTKLSNDIVKYFGDHSLDETGDMANMIHDALSHHASHYKAALKNNDKALASKHMKDIHDIMHFSRKLSRDGVYDHSRNKLNIEAVDPKPWERSFYSDKKADGTFVTDTKGWSRNGGDYSYMQGKPHEHYSKETDSHGHKGAYPLEEIKVNGKYLHIEDVNPNKYESHEFDHHPILKNRTYNLPQKSLTEDTVKNYLKDVSDYETSHHMDKYYDRHEKLQQADPEKYAKRGLTKPSKIITDPVETTPSTPEVKQSVQPSIDNTNEKSNPFYHEVHSALSEEARNHPDNADFLQAVKNGTIHSGILDKNTIVNTLNSRPKKQIINKSLMEIKESLLKNIDFLKTKPELLIDIKERLIKASKKDDALDWLKENDKDFNESDYTDEDEDYIKGDSESDQYDGEEEDSFKNLFDRPEDTDTDNYSDDEDRTLVESEEPQYVDINDEEDSEPIDTENEQIPVKETKKSPIDETPIKETKKSPIDETPVKKPETESSIDKIGYSQWAPRKDYTPEQRQKMNKLVEEGYHPGDAEILAGAHKRFTTMKEAAQQRVHPHEMSSKMHDMLRDHANNYLKDITAGEHRLADPSINPILATAGSAAKSYDNVMEDFRTKKEAFENQDHIKKMSPRLRHQAISEWKANYHKENPGHLDSLVQHVQQNAENIKANTDKRKETLDEGKQAIIQSGKIDTEAMQNIPSYTGEHDTPMTTQGAYQSAGFDVDDEGKMSGGSTIKDPYSTFAEKNPEVKAKLTEKLHSNLDDSAMSRLKRINMHKGGK